MLRRAIARVLDDRQKRALKSKLHQAKQRFVRMWLNYDVAQLNAALRRQGINETDTLLVHSNFDPHSGFKGTPADLADALATFVGDRGNLLMVSIPFRVMNFELV